MHHRTLIPWAFIHLPKIQVILESSWASMRHLYAMSSSRVFKKLLSCHVTSLIRAPLLVGSRVLFWQAFLSGQGFLVGPGKLHFFISAHLCFPLYFILSPSNVG
ncbi:hypothetical protein RchiOBHm_Chr2g0145431 [Rosa chinensis]|uniref:Uncharacterized protein n=1 Tax=Rosa chinensis TaxID=74649 RepID=A0A2P6RYL4_ROSCH|nr:hypothetical protein RchiOBHm_Chr2g0145431 [Rosa chinensis]